MRTLLLVLLLAVPTAALAGKAALKGRAAIGGIGPVQRITIFNDGTTNWSNCELRLPNNKHYKMPALKAHEEEGIMITRFVQDGTEVDKPLSSILVKCDQGQATFNFSL